MGDRPWITFATAATIATLATVVVLSTVQLELAGEMPSAVQQVVRNRDVLAVDPTSGFPARESNGERTWWWMTEPQGLIEFSGPPSSRLELTFDATPTPCGTSSISIGDQPFEIAETKTIQVIVTTDASGMGAVDVRASSPGCGPSDGPRVLYASVYDPTVSPAPD